VLPATLVTAWKEVGHMLENPVYPTTTSVGVSGNSLKHRRSDNVGGAENQQERP
jgi:hypothetical protein